MRLNKYLSNLKKVMPMLCYCIIEIINLYISRYLNKCISISDNTKDIVCNVSIVVNNIAFWLAVFLEIIILKRSKK